MRTVFYAEHSASSRSYFNTETEARAFAGEDGKVEAREIPEGKKIYAVYISDSDFYTDTSAAFFYCKNKTEARANGQLYIRQWQLTGEKIREIREVC